MTEAEIIGIIRSLRNKKGYTQTQVANKLGIGERMYNKYENGKSQMTLKTLLKVFETLDTDLYQLLEILKNKKERKSEQIKLDEIISLQKKSLTMLEEAKRKLEEDL